MSFLKYQEDASVRQGNGRGNLSFSRAHIDGMPWRGPSFPMKEEEFEDYSEQVNDFDVGLFDIRKQDEYLQLREIFDRVANGWYQILDYDKQWVENKDGSRTVVVYVMYAVPHKELAKGRAMAQLMPTTVPEHAAPWRR